MGYPNDWEDKVFQSSFIHSGKYSPSRRTLVLRLTRGQKEHEYQVPPNIWDGLKGARSPGNFVRDVIFNNFFGKKR